MAFRKVSRLHIVSYAHDTPLPDPTTAESFAALVPERWPLCSGQVLDRRAALIERILTLSGGCRLNRHHASDGTTHSGCRDANLQITFEGAHFNDNRMATPAEAGRAPITLNVSFGGRCRPFNSGFVVVLPMTAFGRMPPDAVEPQICR